MQERRTANRYRASLNVRWETLRAQGRGAVCDLSSSGCFVLAGGEITTGDLVKLELIVADDVTTLWGQVVYQVPEMGFAARFVFGSENGKRALDRLIGTITQAVV